MQFANMNTWIGETKKPLVIAGPCSAETEEQLLETCKGIKEEGIEVMRAGVWKPRTRPNNFEGIGSDALGWIQNVKKELNVKFAVEVANPYHVEECLAAGIDILWVGARSTVNPFTVQEIADALKGVDVPVLVKNPINPDLALWMGAIERINNAGIDKIGAIHRGFSAFQETKFRNVPTWQIPIQLKSKLPDLPIICDPSHICGNRELLQSVAQKAIDLNYDGLMIETHRNPSEAWSDAKQQVTPARLGEMIRSLKLRKPSAEDKQFDSIMEQIREQIDEADREIVEALATRMQLVEKIGDFKKTNDVTIFQMDRWNEIFRTRAEWAKAMNISPDFVQEIYKLIHVASIKRQTEVMNQITENLEE